MKSFPLEMLRHSTAHLLAAAVKRLYPKTKLGIGPVIENGFYYDFDLEEPLSSADFPKIEAEMKKLVREKIPYVRIEKTIEEALKFAKDFNEPFKVDLISDLKREGEKKVSFYQTGDFTDLCTGPHVGSTADIRAFKILSLAAAYWKGNEKNKS